MPFRASVEAWRPLADAYAADAPADFLLSWIDTESGGNRCNLTTGAGFPEVGLFQLDPGNAAVAGVDQSRLQANCAGQVDRGTDADREFAMASGVEYVKALKILAHARLQAVGTDWDESTPDFWSLVRLQFSAGGGATEKWLGQAAQALGRGPANWAEFVANVTPSQYFNHWSDVAFANGQYGAGYSPGLLGGLSRGDVVMISLASMLGLYAALRFSRWLTPGEAV
jgi:hypothetical protein